MQTKKLIEVSKVETVEKVCDKCGFKTDSDNFVEWQEFQYFYYQGGYGSVLGDLTELEADLCQRCYKDLLGPYLRDCSRG